MARLPSSKKFHEMDRVERAIDRFVSIEKPTRADLDRVRVVARSRAYSTSTGQKAGI